MDQRRSSLELASPPPPPPPSQPDFDDDLDLCMSPTANDSDFALDLDLTMPPTEEDDVLDSQSRAKIYTPPPHIAARFYRPSHARRRDSAASSRRNSVSSAHSRCSSTVRESRRVSVGGDQSKHVAQHLRRASILEDRKARLADRAAHAEKVRLRAATAKAASRDISVSEERALAAQQAREKNLAEIVATCAEEVKKAKQVATSMKEKRETEMARLKAQMQEKLAEADRRREELRKQNAKGRARGQSVMARKSTEFKSPPKPRVKMSPEIAAARIAGWWRGYSRRKVMLEFHNLGLSVDGIRDTSFDTVTELLAQDHVLTLTARLLRICGLQEAGPGSVGEMAAVRTFLRAFLILGHPNQVLANKTHEEDDEEESELSTHRLPAADLENPQLQDLVGKAKDLLITFENILVRLTPANRYTVPPALSRTLPESYAVFHNAFIAWKSRDSNALIEVMLMQFVELDAIFHTVKDKTDDAAAQLYRQSIQDSQLMLIVRIKKLAGQEKGKKLIFDAVSESRKARKTKKKTADTKPRVADSTTGEASATVSPDSQIVTPPSTPASKREGKEPVIKGGLNGLLPSDNRIVVHELAINKEYQIPTEEYTEQQATISRPIFAQMRASMDESDTYANFQFFMLMARDIKDKLQRLLKEGNSMHNLIGEILDPEVAKRSYTHGTFSYEKFFQAMASLLPKLCAPFRDDEVKDLVDNKLNDGHLIDRVEALSGFIDVMLCDYVNYLLHMAAPGLIESSAQYEAKRFAEEVESQRVTLQAAGQAWRAARSKILAETARRDPEGINHPKSRPTAPKVYAQMLVDIFTQPLPISEAAVPEMLRLDTKRITEVSTTVQRIITVGAVLLQAKNLLKRDVRSPWKVEASRIMNVLEANHADINTTVEGTMAAVESRSMPAATKTHLRALVTKIITASSDMRNGLEPREPVLRLLLTRLRGNILTRLAPGSASDRVKAANTAGEKLATLGLSEFVDRVRIVSSLLEKIGEVDRAAHGAWWDAIATRVEGEEKEA